MIQEDLVLVETKDEGVATLTLNRPEKRNALNIEMLEMFCSLMEGLSDHRAIIIRGNGSCFCAGMDLVEATDEDLLPSVAMHIAHALTAIHKSRAATVAVVHGYAVAGGAGLMAACDFVVAKEGTLIGFPEVRRGLVAAKVMAVLKHQMRQRELRELLLRGHLVSAQAAAAMGLVNTVTDDDPMNDALEIAQDILRGGPKAIAQTKKLIDVLNGTTFENDLQKVREFHQDFSIQSEAQEGIAAWKEKRAPNWVKELKEPS